MRRSLPRTVVVLGVVSLLTDLSSEMIYPLLPLFLTVTLGAGPLAIGIIEGIAESTAAVVKLLSGLWSDRAARRTPFILGGYSLSSLARPLIAFAPAWPAVLALRFVDRVGKGIRGAPRDALIADVVGPGERGAAFGLQRAMDHAGAVLAPLVAAALLGLGLGLPAVFLAAAVPGAAVVVLIAVAVRDPAPEPRPADRPSLLAAWRRIDPRLGRLLAAVAVFGLGNSSDAFILLLLTDQGVAPVAVAALWSAHHVVKVVATWSGGRLSDRLGRRPMLVAGWAVYAAVYLGFATASSTAWVIGLFLAYGLYFGLTEPVEKALVADLAPARLRGAAFGLFHAVTAVVALPASLLFGLLWRSFGAGAAFATGAALAAVAAALLLSVDRTEAAA